MRERRRALRPAGGRDAGMTLIELMVAMVVFSISIAIAFSAVIVVVQKSNDAQQSANAEAELRLALAQIDRQVRSGNVLFSPAAETTDGCQTVGPATDQAGTCMRIFTQSNGDEKCVQWQLYADTTDPGSFQLRSRSWQTDWATTGQVSDWGVVARGLHLGTKAPFTLLGATTVYNERMLQVHLEVTDERRDTPVSIDSSLTGRNTSYGYDTDQCFPVPPA